MTGRRVATGAAVISPKVIAGFLSGGGAVILFALLTAITPDLLAPLGVWAPVVLAGITALASVVAGYIKTDPLRETPAADPNLTDDWHDATP